MTEIVERINELVMFDEVAATIAKWKAENEKLIFAYDTPDGEKEARSHIAKFRKVKTEIANIHKDAKAEALAYGRRLDAKKNEYTGEVDEMIKFHKDPLDAIEAEKTAIAFAKAQAHEAERMAVEAKKQADLEAREAEIQAKQQAIWDAENELRLKQEEIDRKEREKKIAEEAAEQARKQAESEAKAKAQAKELAEKKRKEAEEAKEQKRIQDTKHRQDVENKILNSFTAAMFNPDMAYTILTMLKENKIPNVTINY
jgi:colicin import membrane protein